MAAQRAVTSRAWPHQLLQGRWGSLQGRHQVRVGLSPPRPGAEGLEEGGVGSGEGSRWAGIKPGSAPAPWSLGRRTAGLHVPRRGRAQESSCLSRPGIGPASEGGALRVGSLPDGEGEGEGRGSVPGSRRYCGGGGRFITRDAAPTSRAAACSPGI